ncbi:MAG: AraC family transcriptional regulator [Cyanobacteria bacterium J06626_4]
MQSSSWPSPPRSTRPPTLSTTDWQAICQQAQQCGEQLCQMTAGGTQTFLPQRLGTGGEHHINLRGGLSLVIRQGHLRRPLRYVSEHDAKSPLVAKFYLSGSSRVDTPNVANVKSTYEEQKGCHYLYYLPNLTEVEEWPADESHHVVYVCVEPNYFRTFEMGSTAPITSLQSLLHTETPHRFHQPLGRITSEIGQILRQITHCPYAGIMQQLYLESKALELLTLQFATWAEQHSQRPAIALKSPDIEQLYQARDILQQQADQPPSLTELARQVGLNDRKLKQGFRQLFGTTVFGYLQSYRLEQAQLLLKNADFTIAQVALKVGYTNPEAFSTAFRRKFAVSPKAYQLGRHR